MTKEEGWFFFNLDDKIVIKCIYKRDDSLILWMILFNFGDDKMESSLNFYSKILCRVSGLIVNEK